MKVLVTGASGFVGAHVCPALKSAGHEVVAGLRNPGTSPFWDETRMLGDLESRETWEGLLDGIEAIVHLAARAHVMRESSADPLDAYRRANVTATSRLLQAASRARVRRFIYLSSVKAVGEGSTDSPIDETHTPHPEDPYGISKLEAEMQVRESQLETVILRPPLVYGAGVKANFRSLVRAVDRGIPLPLGSIRNRRSLVSAANLADAIVACVSHPDAAGETFFVTDGPGIATPELIRAIAHSLGRKPRLIPIAPGLLRLAGRMLGASGAVDRLVGSLEISDAKIRQKLGWKPPLTLADGLADTVRGLKGEG